MIEIKMAENNKILEIKVGSHLYGTNNEKSDIDYAGIFVPDIEYIFGLKNCEEVDLGVKSKLPNGKNAPDAIDRKMYEFRKFVKLAMDNNPNILSMLFVNKENTIYINSIGEELLSLKKDFLNKNLVHKFLAYASAQKHKMIIKKEHYDELDEGVAILDNIMLKEDGDKLLLTQCSEFPRFKDIFVLAKESNVNYRIGERGLVKNQTVKRAKSELEKIIGESSHRRVLIKEKGYDTKFSCNVLRLLDEGRQLIETKEIIYPLQNSNVKRMKDGEFSLEESMLLFEEAERSFMASLERFPLSQTANLEKINEFVIRTLKNKIKEEL